uniref:Uncharacterized protein n=1 Tax=Onchocerca volvulus TaxID=6282 RepID=A0A8R1XSH8_ONCVO
MVLVKFSSIMHYSDKRMLVVSHLKCNEHHGFLQVFMSICHQPPPSHCPSMSINYTNSPLPSSSQLPFTEMIINH